MRVSSRMFLTLWLAVAGGCAARAVGGGEPTLALVGATLIDGTDRPAVPDAVVLIRAGRILAAGPRREVAIPGGATVTNVAGSTIIPGLIDSHVHLGMSALDSPGGIFDSTRLAEFLRYGVTTIRDPGDGYPWILQTRDLIAAGKLAGPRIVAAGPTITAPGGHPAGTLLKAHPEAIASGTRQVTSAADARAAVQELASGGVDFIKAIYDGGSRRSPFGLLPKLDRDALAAIVEEAHRRGLPVTVHWSSPAELPDVVAAGPDQVEHIGVSPIADSIIATLVSRRIIVDPTLAVYEKMLPPDLFKSLSVANASRLARAGVMLTAGTDSPLGGLPFGESLHHELELLVSAGLTPIQVIQAATRNAAIAMRRDRDVGTLRPGLRADLVVLARDPLESISNTRQVRMVMLGGRIVTPQK